MVRYRATRGYARARSAPGRRRPQVGRSWISLAFSTRCEQSIVQRRRSQARRRTVFSIAAAEACVLSSACSSNSLSVNNLRRLTPSLAGAAGRPSFPDLTDVTDTAIVREVLPNGLRLLTERMPHVRSVSIGVWLARGSRHEPQEQGGIAHFVEHMLFKGTATRSAEDIAQAIDSVGGQMDAFTAKEYASYYIKVLDEHLPFALDVLSDIVMNPRFSPDDIEREKKVVLEDIKMVEDTPDDLVHELFTENFWADHPLGRPILGTKETVESLNTDALRRYFLGAYTAPNLIVAAVGNVDHAHVRDLVARAFDKLPRNAVPLSAGPPRVDRKSVV